MKARFQRIVDLAKAKAKSIMFTTLVLLGLLQTIAGVVMDIFLYGIAILVVLFFTKITRR